MKFAQWFGENEQTFPNSREYYLACVILPHYREEISKFVEIKMQKPIPSDWTFEAHHMTVKFNINLFDFENFKNLFGKDVDLQIKALGWNNDCIAAVVNSPVQSVNPIPHITIAYSRNVKAFYSNEMLQNGKNIQPNTFDATPIKSVFCAVKKSDKDSFWPPEAYNLIYS